MGSTLVEAAEVFRHSRACHSVFSRLRSGPIPAIATVHGATIGGGLELAATCHIRVADETAFFALPEGERGIYVGGGASVSERSGLTNASDAPSSSLLRKATAGRADKRDAGRAAVPHNALRAASPASWELAS